MTKTELRRIIVAARDGARHVYKPDSASFANLMAHIERFDREYVGGK